MFLQVQLVVELVAFLVVEHSAVLQVVAFAVVEHSDILQVVVFVVSQSNIVGGCDAGIEQALFKSNRVMPTVGKPSACARFIMALLAGVKPILCVFFDF